MIIDQLYKISIFGYFNDIVPTPETVQDFLETFGAKGLLPSIFQEVIINDQNEQPEPLISQQRIALISADGTRQAPIASNRLDYEIQISGDRKLSIEEAKRENEDILDVIGEITNKYQKKANRIALNTTSLVVELGENGLENFMRRFTNPISIYSGVLHEWNTRMMIQEKLEISGKDEIINVITNVAKTKIAKHGDKKIEKSDGFVVSCDINTAPKAEPRFEKKDIECFINYAIEKRNIILNEME